MIDVLDCITFHCVNDKTKVTILDHSGVPLASGNWYQVLISEYCEEEAIEMHYDALQNKLRIRIRVGG